MQIRWINIDGLLPLAHCLITFSSNLLCNRISYMLNVLFLLVPTFTSAGALPLQLEQRIRNLNNIIKQNRYKLTILIKCGEIITHLTVRTLVEYTSLVDSLFFLLGTPSQSSAYTRRKQWEKDPAADALDPGDERLRTRSRLPSTISILISLNYAWFYSNFFVYSLYSLLQTIINIIFPKEKDKNNMKMTWKDEASYL